MKVSIKYNIPARKLDFVNINLAKDNKLFIDPLKIRRGKEEIHKRCYNKIETFVNMMIKLTKDESKFVIKYKNGGVHVLGNKLREEYPCTKYVILDFVKKYDLVYRQYKSEILGK